MPATPEYKIVITNHEARTMTFRITGLYDEAALGFDPLAKRLEHADDPQIVALCADLIAPEVTLPMPRLPTGGLDKDALTISLHSKVTEAIRKAEDAARQLRFLFDPPPEPDLEDIANLALEGTLADIAPVPVLETSRVDEPLPE